MADKDKIFIYEDGRQKVLKADDRLVLKSALAFEGSTDDGFETELAFEDPTDDRTITFPDETGDVALLQSGAIPSPSSIPVKNPSTTTALTKGQVVYISGHSGNKPEVSLARSNSSSTMPAFGFVTADISAEAEGYITTSGLIKGIATNTFSLGDTLYVSESNAGEVVNSAPTGTSLIQNIGKIVKVDASNGEIMVGGAGRTNATPNLTQGKFFIGNASNQSSTSVYTLPISDGTNGQVLTTNGSGSITFQDAAGGSSDLVNDTTPQLGGTLDLNSQSIQGHLIPSAVDTYTLGSSSAEWKDLYLGDNSTIFFGNDSDAKLIHRPDSGLKLELLSSSEGVLEPVFEMIARNTSSSSGPLLILNHEGSSSNNNVAGTLRFQADTSLSNTFYAYLYTTVKERTHANHAGEMNFVVKSNGSNTVPIQITGNNSDLNVTTKINKILNVADHNGTTGLQLSGTLVTSTAAELNLLDGASLGSANEVVTVDSGGSTFDSNSGMIFESGGQVAIGVSASDPSNRTNYAHIYSKDVSSSAELFVRDEAGNVTQISPHNEEGDWVYWSENIKTGKKVKVNMEKMIRRLEEITGERFFEEYIEGN